MRRCVALHDSSALLGSQSWASAQRKYNHHSSRANASSSSSAPTAAQTSDEAATGSENLTIDKDAKTVKTAVGDLPLSPVMDPTFWEARERFKQKKPRPGKPENALAREMRKNPFAQALATTLRHDVSTKTRLPSFFLLDFKLVAHPETGNPWWMPRNLTLNKPLVTTDAGDGEVGSVENNEFPEDGKYTEETEPPLDKSADEHKTASCPVLDSATPPTQKDEVIRGPSAYVLARQDVLRSISTPGTPKFNLNRRLFGATTSRYKSLAGNAVWRRDMDTFVLDQMRRQVVQSILYLSKMCSEQKRYYIMKCFGWSDVKNKHRGAILWFEDTVGEGANPKVEPGPFAVFDIETDGDIKTGVVVHNMPMLLGHEHSQRVRKEASVLQDGSIFMLAGRRTADLQLRLWKLQGYLSDFQGPL